MALRVTDRESGAIIGETEYRIEAQSPTSDFSIAAEVAVHLAGSMVARVALLIDAQEIAAVDHTYRILVGDQADSAGDTA